MKHALYRLKQGGCQWYACIDKFLMQNLGFACTFTDHSLYVYESRSSVIIVPLYVDDLLIGYEDENHMLQIKDLEQWFKMVDAGPASWVLGMCHEPCTATGHVTSHNYAQTSHTCI